MPAQPAPAPLSQPTEAPYPSPRYAWYVVGVLTLVYVFSFIDRQILSLLVRPLRRDLHITDTEVSILMGFRWDAWPTRAAGDPLWLRVWFFGASSPVFVGSPGTLRKCCFFAWASA